MIPIFQAACESRANEDGCTSKSWWACSFWPIWNLTSVHLNNCIVCWDHEWSKIKKNLVIMIMREKPENALGVNFIHSVCYLCYVINNQPAVNSIQGEVLYWSIIYFGLPAKVWILEFRKCLENLKRIWGVLYCQQKFSTSWEDEDGVTESVNHKWK